MTVQAFLSYAHEDEAGLKRLKQCLATLKRQGLIADWSDHQITAGGTIHNEIKTALKNSQLFIALVSFDYVASKYCWDTEFNFALEQREKGKMQIIPIIYDFCDWKNTPLGKILCVPKDGNPITSHYWQNQNEAWSNVIEQLRSYLQKKKQPTTPTPKATLLSNTSLPNVSDAPLSPSPSLPSLPKAFTDYEKQAFVKASFQLITDFFENQISLLQNGNNGWHGTFEHKAHDLALISLFLDGSLVTQVSIFLAPEDVICFHLPPRKATIPSIIGYYEGALETGKYIYTPYMGVAIGNSNSHTSAMAPSCTFKYQEKHSSQGWEFVTNQLQALNGNLSAPGPDETLSAQKIAQLFWGFLIKKASDILKQRQNPYTFGY